MRKRIPLLITAAGALLLLFALGESFGWWTLPQHKTKVTITPSEVDLGQLELSEDNTEQYATFTITNNYSKKISIVGQQRTCSCASCMNIPLDIEPKQSAELKVKAYLSRYYPEFEQSITFSISTPKYLVQIPVCVKATILNPLPRPEKGDQVQEESCPVDPPGQDEAASADQPQDEAAPAEQPVQEEVTPAEQPSQEEPAAAEQPSQEEAPAEPAAE
ncbi:MAG: DUF1573 domain-containing protein [Thermoguttaceae bacterium]|nr:DUF1573 domain-containing protein [Thermoguttaceae bacterium]